VLVAVERPADGIVEVQTFKYPKHLSDWLLQKHVKDQAVALQNKWRGLRLWGNLTLKKRYRPDRIGFGGPLAILNLMTMDGPGLRADTTIVLKAGITLLMELSQHFESAALSLPQSSGLAVTVSQILELIKNLRKHVKREDELDQNVVQALRASLQNLSIQLEDVDMSVTAQATVRILEAMDHLGDVDRLQRHVADTVCNELNVTSVRHLSSLPTVVNHGEMLYVLQAEDLKDFYRWPRYCLTELPASAYAVTECSTSDGVGPDAVGETELVRGA
jgi:hypothetical protein